MKLLKRTACVILFIVLVLGSAAVIALTADHLMSHWKTVSFAETGMQQITHNGLIDTFYDVETHVMYVRTSTGTLTVMVNADGTPKLWMHDYE